MFMVEACFFSYYVGHSLRSKYNKTASHWLMHWMYSNHRHSTPSKWNRDLPNTVPPQHAWHLVPSNNTRPLPPTALKLTTNPQVDPLSPTSIMIKHIYTEITWQSLNSRLPNSVLNSNPTIRNHTSLTNMSHTLLLKLWINTFIQLYKHLLNIS